MCRKINTEYFIYCETLSQGMWNESSLCLSHFKTEQFLGAHFVFTTFTVAVVFLHIRPVCPKCSLANVTVRAMGNKKSPLSNEA